MIISGVGEEAGASPPRPACAPRDVVTQQCGVDDIGDSSLAQGLVFLYKNLDLGPAVPTDRKPARRPNQYVETVVYESTDSESDMSPVSSRADLRRPDDLGGYLNGITSTMNTLCGKLGNTELTPSYMTRCNLSYHRELNLFNDLDSVFPASLLDCVLHRRADSYSGAYMEHVIRHVRRTIEHLKKISNGDYLTEKAREKWRQVEISFNKASVLAPAPAPAAPAAPRPARGTQHVLPKLDVVVRSELDMKSLTRIIEKKIIVEIPEIICRSFRNCKIVGDVNKKILFPTCILKMNKSNILLPGTTSSTRALPMPAIEVADHKADVEINNNSNHDDGDGNNFNNPEEDTRVVPIDYNDRDNFNNHEADSQIIPMDKQSELTVTFDFRSNDTENREFLMISDSSILDSESENLLDVGGARSAERGRRLVAGRLDEAALLARDMREQVRRLLAAVQPTPLARLTIKSPYENKSYILEEKKRKKLLEIRVKRERLKLAMAESSKITKHKYVKGTVVAPQAANSVTKLSITNKTFYKSIFGDSESAQCIRIKDLHKHYKDRLDAKSEQSDKENMTPICLNSDFDLETQVRLFPPSPVCPLSPAAPAPALTAAPASLAPSDGDFDSQLKIFSQILATSYNIAQGDSLEESERSSLELSPRSAKVARATSPEYRSCGPPAGAAPPNSPLPPPPPPAAPRLPPRRPRHDPNRLITTPLECRKNIDKIYDLIKCKLSPISCENDVNDKTSDGESNTVFSKDVLDDELIGKKCHVAVSVMKLHDDRVNPSSKPKMVADVANETPLRDIMNSSIPIWKSPEAKTAEKPVKVVISTMSGFSSNKSGESPKYKNSVHDVVFKEKFKTDKEKRHKQPSAKSTSNDPLKTISKLITDLDNVKRGNRRLRPDLVTPAAPAAAAPRRPDPPRRNIYSVRAESPRAKIAANDKSDRTSPKAKVIAEAKTKDSRVERIVMNKIKDILDEHAEAQGEAVRGPAGAAGAAAARGRPGSRLDALAQPKRMYVQAHSAELRTKHGRSLMSDRVQRLATRPAPRPDPRPDPRHDPPRREPPRLHRAGHQRPPAWEYKATGNTTRDTPSTVSSVVIDQPPIKISPKILAELQINFLSDKDKNLSPRKTKKEEKDPPNNPTSTLSDMSIVLRDPSRTTQRAPPATSTQLGRELHNIVSSIISSASRRPRPDCLPRRRRDQERSGSLHRLEESLLEYSSASLLSVDVFGGAGRARPAPSASLQLLLVPPAAPRSDRLRAVTNSLWNLGLLDSSIDYALRRLNAGSMKALTVDAPKRSESISMVSRGSQCRLCARTRRADQATQLVIDDLIGDVSSSIETKSTEYPSSLSNQVDVVEDVRRGVDGRYDDHWKCKDNTDSMANESANSLDILVNLLNEIHSITTSQSNIAGLEPRQVLGITDLTISDKKTCEVVACQTNTNLTLTEPNKIMKDAEVDVIFNQVTIPNVCKHLRSNFTSVDKQIGVDFKTELVGKIYEKSSLCLERRKPIASDDKETIRKVSKTVSHAESVMKIKRDVLVTVYSLLVLTVFAMLSVPQIIV